MPIISLISYSLFALDVVAIELTVSTYFCDDRGLLPIDDLGLRGLDVVCSGSASSFDLSLSKGFELSLCSFAVVIFFVLDAYSVTLVTDAVCFIRF